MNVKPTYHKRMILLFWGRLNRKVASSILVPALLNPAVQGMSQGSYISTAGITVLLRARGGFFL
jgi:hypothetical protein